MEADGDKIQDESGWKWQMQQKGQLRLELKREHGFGNQILIHDLFKSIHSE